MNDVKQILVSILNMSLSASFVVAAVLILRLLLKKAPKIYSYLLWLIVFFRFLCPLTIKSVLSLIPVKQKAIISYGDAMRQITVNTGIKSFDSVAYNAYSYIGQYKTPVGLSGMEIILYSIAFLWFVGVLTLLTIFVVRYISLIRTLRTATLLHTRNETSLTIYETDQISSPFLLGMFSPRIYLPVGMNEQEREYVLAHERMHVKRKDFIIKPICYFAVILHWFNPLIWISYYLMVKDMEMCCDEAVIRGTKEDIRTEYSTVLLNVSIKQSRGLILPLAFGESNTKARIKNVLKLKKPSVMIGIFAVFIVTLATITLMTSTKSNAEDNSVGKEASNGLTMEEALAEYRTLYIGNHVSDLNLLGLLPTPSGLVYDHIELKTKNEPYELTVFYTSAEGTGIEASAAETAFSNAVLLHATIENMSACNFQIGNDENSTVLTYQRAALEELFGPLFAYSENAEGIVKLNERINEYLKDNAVPGSKTGSDISDEVTYLLD